MSELVKATPNTKVIQFLETQASVDLYLSVITLGEIRKGIEKARPTKPESAARYEAWLTVLVSDYGGRILPLDPAAADIWGHSMASHPQSGVEDAQIAAIAAAGGLVIVTRNVVDFQPFGVSIHNPF